MKTIGGVIPVEKRFTARCSACGASQKDRLMADLSKLLTAYGGTLKYDEKGYFEYSVNINVEVDND